MFWNNWKDADECEFDEVLPKNYMIGIVTPVFLLIWIIMFLLYTRIWREASKHLKQLRTSTCGVNYERHSDWKSVQVKFNTIYRYHIKKCKIIAEKFIKIYVHFSLYKKIYFRIWYFIVFYVCIYYVL